MGNKQNNEKNSGTEKKRSNKTCSQKTQSFFIKRFKRYWPEMLALAVIGGSTGCVHFLWEPYNGIFLERDPALSLPYIEDAQTRLPIAVIIFLVIALPIILTFILQMTLRFCCRPKNIHPKAIDPFYGVIILGLAMAVNGFFSELLKSYVGDKRPNFFSMCNYKGYRDAMNSNNYTYYLANTDPNMFGNVSDCWDKANFETWQSRSSYPSGHASYSYCGYTIFGLLSIYVWHCVTRKHKIFKVIYFLILMILALFFSWSRVLDYWHDSNDIFAGAVIGGIIGSAMFFANFSFSTVDKLKKKIEKDIEKDHKKDKKDKKDKKEKEKEASDHAKNDESDENTSMLEDSNV
jgi:membrane-associated phospholipid phosphatase